MSSNIKYVQFEIPEDEHRKLKLLCIEKNCTLKSLLQEAVRSFVSTTEPSIALRHPQHEGESPTEDESFSMKMSY